jgi:hypothetical protein
MDEIAEIAVQAAAENIVDAVIAKPFQSFAGEALGFIGVGTRSGVADGAQGSLGLSHGKADGARVLSMKNEHFGNPRRLDG